MTEFALRVPVIVAGAGAAGVVAGLAAAAGDVLILEQDAQPVGSTGMSQGLVCAAGTASQRAAGIDDDDGARLEADILAKTRGATDPALARAIGRGAGACVDWLVAAHDVPLALDPSYPAGFGHSRPRLHGWKDHDGQALLDLLHDRFAGQGGQLLTRASLTDIIVDEGGVRGVEVTRPGGERERIGCDALVLACGGFAANRAMVARHMPEIAAAAYNGHEGNRGAAIGLAVDLGAATADMASYQGYGLLTTPQMITIPPNLVLAGAFLVDASGRRFVDESDDIAGLVHPVLARPDGTAWLVYDEAIGATSRETAEMRQLRALGAPRTGADAATLAAAIGADAAGLDATLREIADAAVSQRPDGFGRRWALDQVARGPLRALRVTGALYHTQGGVVTDAAMRVTGADGTPIRGLFAAGGTARGVSGPSYWGYLPGMGLGSAFAGGWIAGTTLAR